MENQASVLNVPCKTLEGDIIQVPLDVMLQSHTFSDMYRDLELTNASTFLFPVAIKTYTFQKVVNWCNNHIGIAEPIIKEDPATRERIWFELTTFEKKFFDVSVDELAELIAAGNYLDVKSLYLYGCQSLALVFKKNKSPEKIRDLLGIKEDLTEEEIQEIKKQNVWCSY